jgi:hypothetical protein
VTLPLLLEWLGAALGLLGAGLLATNTRFSAYGWLAFLASNVCWISYAHMLGAWGLLAQQIGFTATSCIGLWRWRVGRTKADAVPGEAEPCET